MSQNICKDYDVIEPVVEEIADGFRVLLFNEKLGDVEKLNSRQIEILSLIKTTPTISAERLATKIGINTRNVQIHIKCP